MPGVDVAPPRLRSKNVEDQTPKGAKVHTMTRSSSLAQSPSRFARFLGALSVVGIGVVLIQSAACKDTGVGDPCTPESEYNQAFLGFSVDEVNFESKSFQCQTRLCLVNHFQGRVSCQYGQDSSGNGPAGVVGVGGDPTKTGCYVPNEAGDPNGKITGDPTLAGKNVVNPQLVERSADKAVYCSCRCANADGKTDDGANYCDCPDGFSCTHLVDSIGKGNEGLTGSFCIKQGTAYDKAALNTNTCDPNIATCQGPQGDPTNKGS